MLYLLAILLSVLTNAPAFAGDAYRLSYGSPVPVAATTAPTFTTAYAINQSNDKIWFVRAWPKTSEAITDVCFRVGARTGTPVQHKISLQTVGTDGLPSGTSVSPGSPPEQAFTPPASTAWDGKLHCETLVNSYTPARGELVAMVIEPCPDATSPCSGAATPDASNQITISPAVTTWANATPGIPYYGTVDGGGASTKSTNTNSPIFAFKTSSSVVGNAVQSYTATSNYNTGTEYGVVCAFPAHFGSTFKVVGLRWQGRTAAAATDVVIKLYDGGAVGDTTVLQNYTLDSDALASNGSTNRYHEVYFDEATLSTLNWGSSYRASITTSGAAANINLNYIEVDDPTTWGAFPGGTTCALTTRGAGNWTDTTTQRPMLEFILEDNTEPTGGHPGIIGG